MPMPSLRTALAAAALAATAVGPAVPPAHAADPTKERPAAGCRTFADDPGDATLDEDVPSDPDLDILEYTLRTTDTALVAYVKVKDLAAGPQTTDGHRYTIDFTFNGHVFSASGSAYKNGTGAIRDGLANTGQAGHVTQLGVDVPSLTAVPPATEKGFKQSGLTVTFDIAGNYVVWVLPIADIVKYGGAPFTGKLTAVDAKATIDNYAISSVFDSTAAGTWTVGDNKCFTVPTKITLSVAKLAATRNVTARLTTASGTPLAGRSVVFYLNGKKYTTLRTASNGTATVRNVKPGYLVKAQFVAVTGYLGCMAQTKT